MPHRLFALIGLALAAAALTGPPANAEGCRHADIAFYTTDTLRLATRLHANPSACANYYISSAPMADGITPRSNIAGAVRGTGAHTMTEIKTNRVADWVAANPGKTWFDAGVEIRRRMATAGYDVSSGDTWAVNEVGAPSNNTSAVAVLDDAPGARSNVRDLVRGLYYGDVGMQPSQGLVWAADPPQLTTDLGQYHQKLQSFLADSAFWTDMNSYVRFWGQETYADAQDWGVAGATLEERTAHVADYFEHANRLAEAGPGATDAAIAFFAHAYMPFGNASYPQNSPPSGGVGFGFTNVPVDQFERFLSGQLYALRSGDRFGFAWVPVTAQTPATTFVAILDWLAASIHNSDTDPSGACPCDADIAGAGFNEAWKAFTTWDPPTNTPEGASVQIGLVTFSSVTSRGSTAATPADVPAPPPGYRSLGTPAYAITTTAVFAGPVEICIPIDAAAYDGYAAHVFRLDGDVWTEITTPSGCGASGTLGTFAVFAADPTPPVIVPSVEGTLGANGWYTSDVTVTWDVTDPQSPITSASGCDATTIGEDTDSTTLTCMATSDGGDGSASVTIKRDATPPTVHVPADIVVNATSPAGAATSFTADGSCVPTSGSVFAIGTTFVTCTATDEAGNSTSASFTVTVKGAAEQLHDLAASIVAMTKLPPAVKIALLARIDAAIAQADVPSTCSLLAAVTAIARLAGSAGAPVVADATRIRAVLGC